MGGNLIPFVNNMQELMLERWTPLNTNARFPRLGITTWENNNYNTHLFHHTTSFTTSLSPLLCFV